MQQLILTFFRDQIQKNIMAKFSHKLKKKKILLARFLHFQGKEKFKHHAEFQKKTMSQSQQRVQKKSKIWFSRNLTKNYVFFPDFYL